MRPHAISRWSMPLAVGTATVGLLVLAIALVLWVDRAASWAYDFQAYYDAAVRLRDTGSPYQAVTLSGPFHPGPFGLYLYSPPVAVLLLPLIDLGAQNAALAWLVLRLAALGATCALMPVGRAVRLATFGVAAASAPVLSDFRLGNISIFVTLLSVVAWRLLDRPGAGVGIALSAALRPTMALVAVNWLLRHAWPPMLTMVATGLVVVAATLPFVGLDGWVEYLTVLRNVGNATGVARNVDLGSALLLLGGPAWAASLALFAGYAVAVTASLLSLRRDAELSFVVTLTATLLLSPLLWDHYLTQLVVPAAFLASRGRAWGLGLPLLGWLPLAILPLAAICGLLLPFLARPPAVQRSNGDKNGET